MKRISVSMIAMLLVLFGGIQAYAFPILAYTNVAGKGNQAFGGDIALVFTVNSGITVVEMGVYDNLGAAKVPTGTNVTVGIYTVPCTLPNFLTCAGTLVPGTSVTFASGQTYTAVGGDLLDTITPVFLAPGNYEVVAVGFNANFKNGVYNSSPYANSFTGSPYLTADGSSFSAHGTLQFTNTNPNANTIYDAGTLDFGPTPTPEPGTLLLMGTGVLGLAGMVRSKFRKCVS